MLGLGSWAFILTGVSGLVWLVFSGMRWYCFARRQLPESGKLSRAEYDFLHSGRRRNRRPRRAGPLARRGQKVSWVFKTLLLAVFRQTWRFLCWQCHDRSPSGGFLYSSGSRRFWPAKTRGNRCPIWPSSGILPADHPPSPRRESVWPVGGRWFDLTVSTVGSDFFGGGLSQKIYQRRHGRPNKARNWRCSLFGLVFPLTVLFASRTWRINTWLGSATIAICLRRAPGVGGPANIFHDGFRTCFPKSRLFFAARLQAIAAWRWAVGGILIRRACGRLCSSQL